jgi:hypothetical protein
MSHPSLGGGGKQYDPSKPAVLLFLLNVWHVYMVVSVFWYWSSTVPPTSVRTHCCAQSTSFSQVTGTVEQMVFEVGLPIDSIATGSFKSVHLSPVHLSVHAHLPSPHVPPLRQSLSAPQFPVAAFGDADGVFFPVKDDGCNLYISKRMIPATIRPDTPIPTPHRSFSFNLRMGIRV